MDCVSQSFTFSEMCTVFDSLNKSTSREIRSGIVREFFQRYRDRGTVLANEYPMIVTNLFPIIRLFIPHSDRDRGSFRLRESQLSKIFATHMPLTQNDKDYITSDWKRGVQMKDDFAGAVANVFTKYMAGDTDLTIFDINQYLDKLASSNRDAQKAIINEILQKIQPIELKWLIRLLLKDMQLHMSTKQILGLYHRDAYALYGHNSNLQATCHVLNDPDVELASFHVQLFNPLRPMLSQRCTANEFRKLMTTERKYHMETKFDGERFQIHMKGNVFKYFSRNGFDFTSSFGKDFDSGNLTPDLKRVFDVKVKSIILDGEMMGWDPITQTYSSKGMRFDVKKLNSTTVYKPVFIAFDMVFLNDEDLTKKPLYERLALMLSVVTPKEGVLKVSQVFEVRTGKEIVKALNESVDKKEEGIVFKDPNSTYKPDSRNGGWWKMKLEYFEDTMHDLDVLILGGYFSDRASNKFRITSYLVMIAVKEQTFYPSKLLSFCKVSSGLSEEDRLLLEIKLGHKWKEFPKDSDPNFDDLEVKWGKDKPDVYLQPSEGMVIEVRGTELVKAKEFDAPYSLRFPRIQVLRDDKNYTEILTVDELIGLTPERGPVQKLSKRHLELEDLMQPARKKPYRSIGYEAPGLPEAEKQRDILCGYEFYVLTGMEGWTKTQVEIDIIKNGGQIVQYETPKTFCIVYGDFHPKVDFYKGDKDIVHLSWLQHVILQGEFKLYTNNFVKYKSPLTKKDSRQDEFGDEHTNPTDAESLKHVVEAMSIGEVGDYIPLGGAEVGLKFEKVVAYFDRYHIPNDTTSDLIFDNYNSEFEFLTGGGVISDTLDNNVNVIIVEHKDEDRANYLLNFSSRLNINPVIIPEEEIYMGKP